MKEEDRLKSLYPDMEDPNQVRKYRFTKKGNHPSGYQEGEVVELPVRCAQGLPWWIPVEMVQVFPATFPLLFVKGADGPTIDAKALEDIPSRTVVLETGKGSSSASKSSKRRKKAA